MEGAIVGIVLTFLCYDLPWAVGAVRNVVEIVSEEGTLNNAVSPAAVSMASFMATLSTQDAVAAAFSKMLLSTDSYRSEAQATWSPGMNGGLFVTVDREGEEGFNFATDSFGGGGGARSFADGIDSGGIFHSMGSRIANAEAIESRGAFLQIYRREVRDSGGPGRFRGGVSIEFATLPHKVVQPVIVNVTATGVAMPVGLGLSGGMPGAAASNVVFRRTNIRERFASGEMPVSPEELTSSEVDVLGAKSLTTLGEDDLCVGIVGAGAGYGDPIRRDPELVARDVRQRLVSPEIAASIYGVVLRDGAADIEATRTAREDLRLARLGRASAVGNAASGGKSNEGEVLHPVGDTLEAIEHDGRRSIRCTVCHQDLGDYSEDYKRSTVMLELPLTAVSPLNARCMLDTYVIRQFLCPGCGTSVAVDVQDRAEPIRDEGRFFASPAPAAVRSASA